MHHPQHRPLRLASAEPATVTLAAAYEGAVMTTACFEARLTCPDGVVRFGAYNGRVTTKPASESTASAASAATVKVMA